MARTRGQQKKAKPPSDAVVEGKMEERQENTLIGTFPELDLAAQNLDLTDVSPQWIFMISALHLLVKSGVLLRETHTSSFSHTHTHDTRDFIVRLISCLLLMLSVNTFSHSY